MMLPDVSDWLDAIGRRSRWMPRRGRRAAIGVELMEARALLSMSSIGSAAASGRWVEDPNQAMMMAHFEDPNLATPVADYEDPNLAAPIHHIKDPNI